MIVPKISQYAGQQEVRQMLTKLREKQQKVQKVAPPAVILQVNRENVSKS